MPHKGGDFDTPFGSIKAAQDHSLNEIGQLGIGGWLLALVGAAITGVQVITDALLLPFRLVIDIGFGAVDQLILTPLGLTDVGVRITAENLGFFGFLAAPFSSALALATIGVFIGFLALSATATRRRTSITDNALWDFFFGTPEEEVEGED
ncbi:MAG: hypothetical protein U5J98_06985 [Halobacteriales archaeon]|nr:hypothetical protein [Halobacteriales archaeon]